MTAPAGASVSVHDRRRRHRFDSLACVLRVLRLQFLGAAAPMIALSLVFPLVGRAAGFSTLHHFTRDEGTSPYGLVLARPGLLAGVAAAAGKLPGGTIGLGSVYVLNTDGTGFRTVHVFDGTDGQNPLAGLASDGTTLYGTTFYGGTGSVGTIFKVNIDGSGFSVLKQLPLDSSPHTNPAGALLLVGNTLYGTFTGGNNAGGSSAFGSLFKIGTDGSGFADLRVFDVVDGNWPICDLQLDGNVVYGTTFYGGLAYLGYFYDTAGTVFKINLDGTGYTVLHKLLGGASGSGPYGSLGLSNDAIYGATQFGGSGGFGTVFKVKRDGSGYTVLHSFVNGTDGGTPSSGVISIGNVVFGTTSPRGVGSGPGTLFKVNMDGTGYEVLHNLVRAPDGAAPSSLIHVGATLYGTALVGGNTDQGTLFTFDLTPTANSQSISTQLNAAVNVLVNATSPTQFPASYSLVSGPDHGSLSGTLPNVTYTPNHNFIGRDRFTFKAFNDVASSNGATVEISVEGVLPAASLVNIATRAYCGTGDNVAIGGFVISGTQSKRVLIRAVGPSLVPRGIAASDVLTDPVLTLYRGSAVLASNDNWTESADMAALVATGKTIGAAAFETTDTKSSALIQTLSPGVYSFIVRGKGDTSGITLLEVFDADVTSGGSVLINLSSRVSAATGPGVAIGGFVISGDVPKQVLLRAVGPTLTTQGIAASAVLTNPVIELHEARAGNAIIATNDNWGQNANADALVTTAKRIGAFPFSPADLNSSALLLTLQPGAYSFVTTGKDGGSGITLVEVYDAD